MITARRLFQIMLVAYILLSCCACAPAAEAPGSYPPENSAAESPTAPQDDVPSAVHPSSFEQIENSAHESISFLFFSDTQANPETGDYSEFGTLLSRAIQQGDKPGLVLFGGDTINDGGDASEWLDFRNVASGPLSGLVTAAIPGNHDSYPLLAEQFDYPGQAPGGQGDGFFYSFGAGGVHFIMLDSNIMGAAREADIEWMISDLQSMEAVQASWRVAVMHHPMWPVVANPKDEARAKTMRESFLPAMEAYGIDLILCGHQHVYSRSAPMRGEAPSPDGKGIVQVMAASGSKESYSADNTDFLEQSGAAPNYLLIEADSERLNITAFDGGGSPIDIVTIHR